MEAVERLAEAMKTDFEKIGLYIEHLNIISDRPLEGDEDVSPDLRGMLESGEAQFALVVSFATNELAFSDKVLNPEAVESDKEFKLAMPSQAEITAEAVRERLRRRKGKNA